MKKLFGKGKKNVLNNKAVMKDEYFMEPTNEEKEEIERILTAENYFDIFQMEPTIEIKDDGGLSKKYMDICLLLNPNTCGHEKLDKAFERLSVAYDTLSDPVSRKRYHQLLFGIAPADDPFLQLFQHMLGTPSTQSGGQVIRLGGGRTLGNGETTEVALPGGARMIQADEGGPPDLLRMLFGLGPAGPRREQSEQSRRDDEQVREIQRRDRERAFERRRAEMRANRPRGDPFEEIFRDLRAPAVADQDNDPFRDLLNALAGGEAMRTRNATPVAQPVADEELDDSDEDLDSNVAQAAVVRNDPVADLMQEVFGRPRARQQQRPRQVPQRMAAQRTQLGDIDQLFEQMFRGLNTLEAELTPQQARPNAQRARVNRPEYPEEMARLREMGFENEQNNLRALRRSRGDVQMAIQLLLD